ncbi:PEP-CTERM sorting domain-containing protein [Pontiella sulfatireligans]|uniref:PEP-CTERM protein-sorting domain-containing protein n=1 Tax=Pontiella sulfatireligans TaxID=2750658 RepID=A0A6C2UN80_9BACT|nr:PEP-CTERM sorting domain-containing protein [Pontiella sulfatireligans]VGO21722.1 hypothetical protein SCARR_03797 [Pontiella sulfatireligans]
MKKLILASVALSCVMVASGTIVYSNNFDSATVGDSLNDMGWTGNGSSAAYVTNSTEFGSGNKLVTLVNDDGGAFRYNDLDISSAGADFVRLSFDMFFPSDYTSDAYVRVSAKGDVADANNGNVNWLDMGYGSRDVSIGSDIAVNTAYHFDVIMNISGSSVTWNGDDVADEQYDIWMNGSILHDDLALDRGDADVATQFNSIGFWVARGEDAVHADVLVDNIVVESIPEPATLGIIMSSAVGILFIRRRFMM